MLNLIYLEKLRFRDICPKILNNVKVVIGIKKCIFALINVQVIWRFLRPNLPKTNEWQHFQDNAMHHCAKIHSDLRLFNLMTEFCPKIT